MQIFRFLFEHKLALGIVIVLLAGVAMCNLALPAFTSQIVDVGIQQSGVEHVTCEEMTSSTHDQIAELLKSRDLSNEKDLQVYENSYDKEGSLYKLNDYGRDHIAELDSMLASPLIMIHGENDESASQADVPNAMQAVSENYDSLLRQRAISATIKEYEATGYDLSGLRISYLVKVGIAMMGLALLAMLFDILISFVASRTGATIAKDLRFRLFSRVVAFSEQDVSKFSAASLITRGTNDIQLVQNVSIMLMRMVLYAPILAIGGITMVILTTPQLGWIVVAAVLFVFLFAGLLFKVTMPKFKIMQKLIDRVNLVAREILTGIPVIRAFNRQKLESERFDLANMNLMRTQLFTNRAMSFMMPTMMLVMNLTSVAIVWFGGFGVADGSLQTGDLIAFITYAMLIIMSFLILSMMAIMLPRANVAAVRVKEVLDTEPSIVDVANPATLPDCSNGKQKGVSIKFDNVSFCYDEESGCENVLEGISFEVEPGQTLAIVGSTGSGKTTILKLIERFYEPSNGKISIDGLDISDVSQSSLRKTIGYAPQNSYLFSGTIATNVAYSDEAMGEKRINEALRIAQATQFVEAKEEGVDFQVSQGGTNLSGGQRQRVSIARAVAADSRLLLFDDSFSALDYKTDAALRADLKEALGNVTCIIVAQRISTVMNADKIIVLEDGRLVGQGNHESLLETCEQYKQLALSQLSEDEIFGEAGDRV